MSKVISFSNQKGGVGKTTTTLNLAVSLAELNKKVLVIDFDPQGNLTMSLGYQNPDTIEITITDLLLDIINNNEIKNYRTDDYILKSHGVDLVPANITLTGLENILINTMSRENILKRFIEIHKKDYDYILIDCMPSLNILTVNALNASNEVIIPVQAQFLSAKGLELLLQTILNVQINLNRELKIAGILITMLDRRSNFQGVVIDTIKSSYGEDIKIFNNIIPLSVKVSENQSKGLPIINEKNNAVAESYINFAKELMSNG